MSPTNLEVNAETLLAALVANGGDLVIADPTPPLRKTYRQAIHHLARWTPVGIRQTDNLGTDRRSCRR